MVRERRADPAGPVLESHAVIHCCRVLRPDLRRLWLLRVPSAARGLPVNTAGVPLVCSAGFSPYPLRDGRYGLKPALGTPGGSHHRPVARPTRGAMNCYPPYQHPAMIPPGNRRPSGRGLGRASLPRPRRPGGPHDLHSDRSTGDRRGMGTVLAPAGDGVLRPPGRGGDADHRGGGLRGADRAGGRDVRGDLHTQFLRAARACPRGRGRRRRAFPPRPVRRPPSHRRQAVGRVQIRRPARTRGAKSSLRPSPPPSPLSLTARHF